MLHSQLVIISIISGLVLAKSNCLQVNSESHSTLRETSNTMYPELWISDLFYIALANFSVNNVGNMDCQKQGEMYNKHLRNHTNWAVKMAESWNRRPIGILAGRRYHFGIYDQCVGVQYPIKGQYCLSEIKLIPSVGYNYSSNKKENLDRMYNSNSWKTILEWTNYPDQVQRNVLNLGICIPDSCTASDLQTSLQNELNKVFLPENVNTIVKMDQIMCTIKEDLYPYYTGFYIVCSIFGLIVTLCCGTTIYHYRKLNNNENKTEASENFDSLFYSFSFIKTMQELLKYNEDNKFNFIDAIKGVAMLIIVCGHIFYCFLEIPFNFSNTMEDMYSNELNFFLSGVIFADVFFFVSGFILKYTSVSKTPGSLWIKCRVAITNRIVRILPAYCAIILITVYFIPHLGDGPMWQRKIWEDSDNCKEYWWANILFINNFIDFKYQCLIMSWYISCDMQLYVVGIVILCIYWKNTKYGIRLLVTIFGLSLLVPFIVTFLTKSDGILKSDIPFLEDPRSSISFNNTYRSSYMRAAPYFLGLITSFVIEQMNEKQIKLSKITGYSGTLIITVINILIHLYGNTFYSRQKPYNPLDHAFYSAISHCVWPILLLWLLICYMTSGYVPVFKFLLNRGTVILGRISYSLMLVNITVTMVSQNTFRLPHHYSMKYVHDLLILETFKCYFMGFMFYLMVEAPFDNITKKLLGLRKQKTSNTNGISNANQSNTEAKEMYLKNK